MRERMSRLADGLALLTDTTEAGLSTLVREIQQLGRRPSVRAASSRNAVARRVAAASRTGMDVATIATSESMSESEVQLHMRLAEAAIESAARGAALSQRADA
jgi:ABC-type hemin transport system ATPase subunit